MAEQREDFEPKRKFRWILEAGDIPPFTLKAIRWGSDFNQYMAVDIAATATRDISVCPVPGRGTGTLKFLDEDGRADDVYEVSWDGVTYWPFVELDYGSSELIVSRVFLLGSTLKRV